MHPRQAPPLLTSADELSVQELRRLRVLDGLTDVVLDAAEAEELLRGAASCLVPTFADWCTVHHVPDHGDPRQVAVVSGHPGTAAWARQLEECLRLRPVGEPAVSSVMRSGRSTVMDAVDPSQMAAVLRRWVVDADGVLEAVTHLGVSAVLAVPLQVRGVARGALWMMKAEPGASFEADEVATIEKAARRISEGLERALTLRQLREISATLQRALLPPKLPVIPGVDLTVRYWPAGRAVEAGGDFYDVFQLGDRRWAVLIGDVCGTGPDAAALTSIARHTVRAAARHGQDHHEVMTWLNEAVLTSNRDRFCSALYATLEEVGPSWELITAAGGHPLPVLLRPGSAPRVLGRPGEIVGVFPSVEVRPTRSVLRPGDVVVLYTDGVTDLPPPAYRTLDDLLDLLAGLDEQPSVDLVADTIERWTTERVGEGGQADDVALVIIGVGGTGTSRAR